MDESDPKLKRRSSLKQKVNKTVNKGWRSVKTGLGRVLETKIANAIVVSVLIIDFIIVITNLIIKLYKVNNPNLQSVDEIFTYITMGFRILYVVMIFVRVASFGFIYLADPLNLFDALIVVMAALFFLFFNGKDQILSSFFIVCRLWRINRIVEANTIKTESKHEEKYGEIQKKLIEQLEMERDVNIKLRKKLEENDRSLSLLMGESIFEDKNNNSLKREPKTKFYNYSYLPEFDSMLKV